MLYVIIGLLCNCNRFPYTLDDVADAAECREAGQIRGRPGDVSHVDIRALRHYTNKMTDM